MAVSAVLKIGAKVAAKSANILKGVTKSTMKNAKIKKRFRVAEKRYVRRRRLEKKRREQEALLEQQNTQKNTQKKGDQKTKGLGGSVLERLISLVQILIMGFVVDKLPQIIESIKKVVNTIRDIIDKVKNFFNSIFGFYKSIGKVVGKVFNFIVSTDLSGISDSIKDAFGTLINSFGDMKNNFESGAREMSSVNSSTSDLQKTIDMKNENFKQTFQTIQKEGTGRDIIGSEFSNLTEQIEPINTEESNLNQINLKDKESSDSSSGESEKIESSTKSEGASGSTVNSSVAKTGDGLNISKPKKTVSTTTITPKRETKNTVMIVGNNGGQSQLQGETESEGNTIIIVKKNNSIKDRFTLSLS